MKVKILTLFIKTVHINSRLQLYPEKRELFMTIEYRYNSKIKEISNLMELMYNDDYYISNEYIADTVEICHGIGLYHGEIDMFATCIAYELIHRISAKNFRNAYRKVINSDKEIRDIYSDERGYLPGCENGIDIFSNMSKYSLLHSIGPIWEQTDNNQEVWPYNNRHILNQIMNALRDFNFNSSVLKKSKLLASDKYRDTHFKEAISVQILKEAIAYQLYAEDNSIMHRIQRLGKISNLGE